MDKLLKKGDKVYLSEIFVQDYFSNTGIMVHFGMIQSNPMKGNDWITADLYTATELLVQPKELLSIALDTSQHPIGDMDTVMYYILVNLNKLEKKILKGI